VSAAAGAEAGRSLTRLYHSKNSFCVLNSGSYADVLDSLHSPPSPDAAPGNGNFSKVRGWACRWPH